MLSRINKFIDFLSDYFAHRKGLLPLIGIGFILVNLLLQFVISGWLVESNLLFHLGAIIAIFGFMLAWAL